MHKIKEVLRLRHRFGFSHREIARSCAVAPSTVGEYLRRAEAQGLMWPLPDELRDDELYDRLFPDQSRVAQAARPLPDWKQVHQELSAKGVTKQLLWMEYRAEHPDGYGYSRFCELFLEWGAGLSPTMRQNYPAGEYLFVDYSGLSASYVHPETGEVLEAPVFVAVLGASDMTYVEAAEDASAEHWIGGHVRSFEFFGGVPRALVPDNLKTGVTHPCRYEPGVNLTYERLAQHYGVAVLPTRVKKPRDKAKAEQGVQGVQRWVLAPLRHETIVGLGNLNHALRKRLNEYLDRPMKVLGESRRERFVRLERAALGPLPANGFEMEDWRKAKVAIDYHVQVDWHYYSVPHRLIGEVMEIRLTESAVEAFHNGHRVASHRRSRQRGGHTTDPEHMPRDHREFAAWTPERLESWAATKGPHVATVVREVMASRRHPQQGFRAAMGVINLANKYGAERLDGACQHGLELGIRSYRGVRNLLESGLDQSPPAPEPDGIADGHENVRGQNYYQ